jgi:GTP cyclohydrolase I
MSDDHKLTALPTPAPTPFEFHCAADGEQGHGREQTEVCHHNGKTINAEAVRHMAAVLTAMGINLRDENFHDTPKRFVAYLHEFLQPYNASAVLKTTFAADDPASSTSYRGMVIQSNIPFRAVCAHHLLPFLGYAHLGYIPHKRVVGLSKLARLVEAVGLSTPSIQEIITDKIANNLNVVLEPSGVIVVVGAIHTCMACRGVAAPNVPTITSSVRGLFRDVQAAREEFFSCINLIKP